MKKRKIHNLSEGTKPNWLFHVSTGCFLITFYLVLSHFDRVMKGFQTLGYFVYPVFMGLVVAYVLSPLVKMFQTRVFSQVKNPVMNRNLSVFLTFAIIILGVIGMMIGLVPQVWSSIRNLVGNMGSYSASLQGALQRLDAFAAGYGVDISETVQSVNEYIRNLTNVIGNNMNTIISTSFDVGKAIFNFIIACILAIYLLCDKFPFQQDGHRLLKALIKPSVYEKTEQFLSQCNNIILRYIVSEMLDALIVGFANALFMMATDMPFVALISLVVGFCNLAPTFGPIVGAVIGALILILVNPWDALGFVVFTIILQLLDGYVIKPRLFGDMLGVSSVWILASIIIGGRMIGVLGILIAIPIAAILALLYQDYVLPMLEHRREVLNELEKEEREKNLRRVKTGDHEAVNPMDPDSPEYE